MPAKLTYEELEQENKWLRERQERIGKQNRKQIEKKFPLTKLHEEQKRLLGISNLSGLGRNGEIWVTRFWNALIRPSFDDWALVGLIEYLKLKPDIRGTHPPASRRAAVVTYEKGTGELKLSEVAELRNDPLRDAVRILDLNHMLNEVDEPQGAQVDTFDRIDYGITIISGIELTTSFRFWKSHQLRTGRDPECTIGRM